MNTPSKLNSGDEFRGGVVRTINAIIEYLRATRIVADNRTIFVNQTTAGVMLSGKDSAPGKGGGKAAEAIDICVTVSAPSAGYGTATVDTITAESDGTWSANGSESNALVLMI